MKPMATSPGSPGLHHSAARSVIPQGRPFDGIDEIEAILGRADSLDDVDAMRLHRHYFDSLVGYARRQGADDPEGAANLALFDGFRAYGRTAIIDESAFRAYLYRAAKSHLLNQSRRRVPIPADPHDARPHESAGAVDAMVEREWMAGLFRQLPQDHQEVLQLRVVEGLSAEEAGVRLGRAPNAVYQLQHRAQQRLRRLVLLALAVLAIVAGAVALWSRTSSSSRLVNLDPIEQPVESTPTTAANPIVAVDPDADATATDAGVGTESTTADTTITTADATTADTTITTADVTTTTADATTIATTLPPPPEVSTTATTTAPVVAATSTLNTCRQVTHGDRLVLELYDPLLDPDSQFVPPVAVRIRTETPPSKPDLTAILVWRPDRTNPGWIVADGTMTHARPAGAAIWGVEVGPVGTVLTQVEYEVDENWIVHEGCGL